MTTKLIFKNKTQIEWNHGDDGGGSTHYTDFLNAIGSSKQYNNCLEWCAGLSAISFSLLDANIINKSVLMDIYEPALTKALDNAQNNNLSDRVSIRLCGKISDLPVTDKFDLVVANPPHAISDHWIEDGPDYDTVHRITVDLDWKLHKEFYANIKNYLNPGADVFISEIDSHLVIEEYANQSGLRFVSSIPAPTLGNDSKTNAFIQRYTYETKIY